MKLKALIAALSAASLLVACGGGGSDAGTPPFGGPVASSPSASTPSTGSVETTGAGTLVMSISDRVISSSSPGTVTVVWKDATGKPVENEIVDFSVTGASAGIAKVEPQSVRTDANGQASTFVKPNAGFNSGAANVTATAGTLTAKTAFSVSASNVTLTSVAVAASPINGYGSTAVNFQLSSASSSNPVTVNVTSTCASAGKATISPSSLSLNSTTGSVTYTDKGCATTDRINVQIEGTAEQGSTPLVVNPPGTRGIQFENVDPKTICLTGTGCPSVANVTFKVVDVAGNGQPNVDVSFSLDPSVSDFAVLGTTEGRTGGDGTVTVSVTSKKTPTPLRVTAVVTGSPPVIQTVSNQLTISGGLPVAGVDDSHNGISFASTKYAMNGNLDGDVADLTLRLTDQWGQNAIDGTVVTLVSDGGTVVPGFCQTKDGACPVKLVVSNPRPANGRVHVIAYAKGQEYYLDIDADSAFSSGDTYEDVKRGVCLDKNENSTCDAGEFIIGTNASADLGNGTWDGEGKAFARLQRLFFFSRTTAAPRLFKSAAGVCSNAAVDPAYMTVSMGNTARKFVEFCVRDANTAADSLGGNPIASGSLVAVNSTIDTVTVAVDNSPVPSVIAGPTRHVVTIQNPTPSTALPASGAIDLTFTMGGTKYTILNAITVNP